MNTQSIPARASTHRELAVVTKRSANRRSVAHFAEEIRARWQETVEGIFATAVMVEAAHKELSGPEFTALWRDELKWSKVTAYSLKSIAENAALREVRRVLLPPSWGTLFKLTQLTDEQFKHGLEAGVIHAGMIRADVARLKPARLPKSKKPASATATVLEASPVFGPFEMCIFQLRRIIYDAQCELAPDRYRDLLAQLALEIADLAQTALVGEGAA